MPGGVAIRPTNSVIKIRLVDRANRRLMNAGTGSVIHASSTGAIVMTAAHVLEPADKSLFQNWYDGEGFRRALQMLGYLSGDADKPFNLEYMCIPEDYTPDIALLRLQPAMNFSWTSLEIGHAYEDGAEVRAFGFPVEEYGLQMREGYIAHRNRGEKFPDFGVSGDVPAGFSGGPVLANGKIVGMVSGSTGDRKTGEPLFIGPDVIAIRRMLENWVAGKYCSPPYYLWPENQRPPIVVLPSSDRGALGRITNAEED